MTNLICFATGNFWKLFKEEELFNKGIDIIKKLEVDGIELTLGKGLERFNISEENVAYLRSLKRVSIHTPFDGKYEHTYESQKLIENLKEVYNRIDAKNIIIHPYQIEDYKLFEGMAYSTENMSKLKKFPMKSNEELTKNYPGTKLLSLTIYSLDDVKKTQKLPIELYEELFKKYEELKLTFDVGHALAHGKHELDAILNKFSDKIIQVHFHDMRYGEDHQQFYCTENPKKYERVKTLNVPIVIEEVFKKLDLDEVKKEIDCVRNYFNS